MDQIGFVEDASIVSDKKSDSDSTLMESKNSDGGASLCPVTPYSTDEKVKLASVRDDISTPVEDVFDSQKLKPDSNQKNNLGNSANSAVRKLDFEKSSESVSENGSLTETVFDSILESIISKQAEDIIAETLAFEQTHDVFMTPPSAARISRLAKCPGAPMKPKRVERLRIVNSSVCRKLDFDSLV